MLDPAGQPVLAYTTDSDDRVAFAYMREGRWVREAVEMEFEDSYLLDLGVDAGNLPVVLFGTYSTSQLWLATRLDDEHKVLRGPAADELVPIASAELSYLDLEAPVGVTSFYKMEHVRELTAVKEGSGVRLQVR